MRLRHLLVLFLLILPGMVRAEKTMVSRSETGGAIEETIYEEGDNEYRYEKTRLHYDDSGDLIKDERYLLANDYNNLGIKKTVKTYFNDGVLKHVEVVFRNDKALLAGYERIVLDFDKTGVRRRMTVYFKDDHRDKRIYSHAVSYYDLGGVITQTVTYFTENAAVTTDCQRIVELFDRKGNKVSEKIYDKDGNEF